jgi:hypothetical protein
LTAQRNSGFARKAHDPYETPAWVAETLLDVVDMAGPAWEARTFGKGKSSDGLIGFGCRRLASALTIAILPYRVVR